MSSHRLALSIAVLMSVLSLVSFSSAHAEEISWSKIGSSLHVHLDVKKDYLKNPTIEKLTSMENMGINTSNPNAERVFLHFRRYPAPSELTQLRAFDLIVYENSWIPPVGNHPTGFLVAEMPVETADEVAQLEFVTHVNLAGRRLFPLNSMATAGANAPSMWAQGLDGSGVLIAVLDSGIDTTHAGIPTLVAGKDYHMAPDSLDDTIANITSDHGTHVTGSVLGRAAGSLYQGSAPGADLVFLKIGGDASSSATDEAMIAAYKAAVDTYGVDIISVSYGGYDDYHDGSSENCQGVDYAVGKGAVFFSSAGNAANDDEHYSDTVPANDSTGFIRVDVSSSDKLYFNLVWYDGTGTSRDLELKFYDSGFNPLVGTSFSQIESPRGTESQYFMYPSVGYIFPGTFYLRVKNNSSTAAQKFHLYTHWSVSYVTFNAPDLFYTVGDPAIADSAIAVGAWVSRYDWLDYCGGGFYHFVNQNFTGEIANFSSRGPRIDEPSEYYPHIAAGGSAVASCRDAGFSYQTAVVIDNDSLSLNCSGPADYVMKQGTSMACPIAAGAAALLLQHNPDLTPAQVRQVLADNASSDAFTGSVPNDTWGHGKLNAFIDLTAPSRIGDFHVTSVSDSSAFLAWTAPGDDTTTGTATEYDIRYHTSLPAKADTAAWWESATQVVGEPTPQGSGSAESMEVTGLSPATPYYFAIKALDEHFNPSELSDITGDITLPVQLSSFQASPVPEGILLEWSTESETNNRGFHLSRSREEEGQFDFVAFVDGAGHSASPRSYRFVDQQVRSEVTYWYLLESEDLQGQRAAYGPIEATAGEPLLPKVFALSQNYPNPFNPTTHIKYQLPKDVSVALKIYNVMGQHVVSLVDDVHKAGYYEVKWAGRDTNGRELASGVYFYRLEAGDFVKTNKMILLR